LEIQFKKGPNQSAVLTCKRADNTLTWSKLHVGTAGHDLAHYAVESTLGFKNAFYGLLSKGYDIADFELPRGQRPVEIMPSNLHPEAIQTEHIVNLLQINAAQGEDDPAAFLTQLAGILVENNLTFPEQLTESSLAEIRTLFHALLFQWHALKEDGVLTLQFNG
jgi:hypothetical protein